MKNAEIGFNEQWSRWEPIAGIYGKYEIHRILYNHDDFRLILKGHHERAFIEVVFPQTLAAIRIANESVVFMIYEWLSIKYGKDFYADWCFFKVENSDCLKWLSNGTNGVSEEYGLIHYVVTDLDLVIDVVTRHAPIVNLLP